MATESNARLREELVDAIANVRRQIDVQSTSDHYLGSGRITEEALSELQSDLSQLEEALAGLQ